MAKAAEAFRTISEVADELDVPKHVLRFWELRFPQIKPMKRGGGRRYYRPADVELLRGIRHLLHAEGYTIKGVQKILREQGVDQVKSAGRPGAAPFDGIPAMPQPPVPVAPAVAQPRPATAGKAKRTRADAPPAPEPVRLVLERLVAELQACRSLLLAAAPQPKSLRDLAAS
jgi:DNA-binding transcriptional MerR regulator